VLRCDHSQPQNRLDWAPAGCIGNAQQRRSPAARLLSQNGGAVSFLDVGAGTGRGIAFLQSVFPESHVIGVEPVAELRAQAFGKGRSKDATGVLHHIKEFRKATSGEAGCPDFGWEQSRSREQVNSKRKVGH